MISKKQFNKQLAVIKRRIDKDRDDLRELMSEAEDILDANERAAEALQDAVDSLSEFV